MVRHEVDCFTEQVVGTVHIRFDVSPNYRNILVAIRSLVFVIKSQSMSDFVYRNSRMAKQV